ncbi:MAG: hypothetical protein ACRECA_03930 [Pseudolabrys sp.]
MSERHKVLIVDPDENQGSQPAQMVMPDRIFLKATSSASQDASES